MLRIPWTEDVKNKVLRRLGTTKKLLTIKKERNKMREEDIPSECPVSARETRDNNNT